MRQGPEGRFLGTTTFLKDIIVPITPTEPRGLDRTPQFTTAPQGITPRPDSHSGRIDRDPHFRKPVFPKPEGRPHPMPDLIDELDDSGSVGLSGETSGLPINESESVDPVQADPDALEELMSSFSLGLEPSDEEVGQRRDFTTGRLDGEYSDDDLGIDEGDHPDHLMAGFHVVNLFTGTTRKPR